MGNETGYSEGVLRLRGMDRNGDGTYFTIDRKIFNSDIWFASPWKLKIWIYLIGNANHADGKFMGIEIKRGQILRSLRTIKKDCGYKVGYRAKYPSLDTVRRVCEDLTKEQRIVQRSVHCGTVFTIINYNTLQPTISERSKQRKQESSYNGRTMVVQNNNNKNNKNNKEPSSSGDEVDRFYLTKKKRKLTGKRLETFEIFWTKFSYKQGKAEAADVWLDIPSLTESFVQQIYSAAEKEAARRPQVKHDGKTPKMAQGWLSGRRWEDEVADQEIKEPQIYRTL